MAQDNGKTAIVLLSGGMDSTTLAYQLAREGYRVKALSVHYGQRHRKELDAAERIAESLGVGHSTIDLSVLREFLDASSLTNDSLAVPHGHYEDESMRLTVVPNRNAILLSVAVGVAVSCKAWGVGYAAHAGDHAVYPDCRLEFVEAFARMTREAVYAPAPEIIAPFLLMSKADIARRGADLGVPYELTWSCYEGGLHHCGKCGTCVERVEAFKLAGVPDPTVYAA